MPKTTKKTTKKVSKKSSSTKTTNEELNDIDLIYGQLGANLNNKETDKITNKISNSKSNIDSGKEIIPQTLNTEQKTKTQNKNDENSSEKIDPNNITETMTILTDKLGNTYMGIHNFYNSFCYFISAVHRLHSSKSLKHELNKNLFDETIRSDSKETHQISKQIMQILIDYNKLSDRINVGMSGGSLQYKTKSARHKILNLTGGSETEKEISSIYNNMFKYKNTIDELFHDDLKHGGDPQGIMLFLFFPIIYHYTDDATFINILKELNFNPIHFSNTNYNSQAFNMIKDNKEGYNNKLKEWYKDILKYIDNNMKNFTENMFNNQFCVTTLCIYFASVYERDYSANAGHAVTMILGNDDQFYIIDDHKNIKLFDDYIKLKKSSIFELELKDLTPEVINKISTWNNYTVDNRIYRTVLRPKNTGMSGGNLDENESGLVNNIYSNEIENYSDLYESKPTLFEVFKWINTKYKTYMEIYYLVLIISILILIVYSIKYIKIKSKLNKVNAEIEDTSKQIKHIKKKYNIENFAKNNIETQTQKLVEQFTQPVINSNQVLDKNAIIKPRAHLNVGIAYNNNYTM